MDHGGWDRWNWSDFCQEWTLLLLNLWFLLLYFCYMFILHWAFVLVVLNLWSLYRELYIFAMWLSYIILVIVIVITTVIVIVKSLNGHTSWNNSVLAMNDFESLVSVTKSFIFLPYDYPPSASSYHIFIIKSMNDPYLLESYSSTEWPKIF